MAIHAVQYVETLFINLPYTDVLYLEELYLEELYLEKVNSKVLYFAMQRRV